MNDSDEITVRFGAETSGLETGAQRSAEAVVNFSNAVKDGLDRITGKLKDTASGSMFDAIQGKLGSMFSRFGSDSRRASGDIANFSSNAGQQLERFSNKVRETESSSNSLFGSIKEHLGLIASGFAMGHVVKEVVSTMSAFENLEIRMRAVMGSAEKGDEAFAWIKKFAKDTPFEVDGVAKSFMLLKNMGLDPMDGTMQAVADQAAKSGQGLQGLERVSLALGQAFTKGKLQGEEMNQLLEAGVPAWDLLAKATGKSTEELHKMSEKGRLGKDVIHALIEEIGRSSANSSGAMMASLSGQWSNLMDNIKNSADDMRKGGGLDGLKDALGQINDRFDALNANGSLQEFVAKVGQGFSAMVSSSMSVLSTLFDAFGELVSMIVSGCGNIIQSLTGAFGSQQMSGLELFVNMLKVIEVATVGLVTSFRIMKELVSLAIEGTVMHILRFAEVAERAMAVDLDGARAAWDRGGAAIEDSVKRRLGAVVDITREAKEKIDAIALRPMAGTVKAPAQAGPAPDDGKRRPVKYNPEDDKKDKGSKGAFMRGLDAELHAQRLAYAKAQQEAGTYYAFSKEQEEAFWRSKLGTVKAGSDEYKAIAAKLTNSQLAQVEHANQQALQLKEEERREHQQSALDALAVERSSAQRRYELRQLSAEQLTQIERNLADREASINAQALQEAIKMEEGRPDKSPSKLAQLRAQLLQVEQKHVEALAVLDQQTAVSAQRAADVRRSAATEAALAAAETEGQLENQRMVRAGASASALLAQEIQTQQKLFQIRMDAMRETLRLEQAGPNDPAKLAELHAQIEALQAQHGQRMNQMVFDQSTTLLKETGGSMQAVLQSLPDMAGQAVDGVLGKFGTLRDGLNGIFKSAYAAFVNEMVTKPLIQMGMRVLRESALYKMLAGIQIGTQTGASDVVATAKATEADTVIGANAAEAASGAAASQAAIPVIGPGLAIGAFAALMALTMSAKGTVRSAAGGFDIPAGLNPLTQLHEKEMVLPAHIAEPLRNQLSGGGGGGDMKVEVRGASMGDFLMMHKSELVRVIKAARRDGVF